MLTEVGTRLQGRPAAAAAARPVGRGRVRRAPPRGGTRAGGAGGDRAARGPHRAAARRGNPAERSGHRRRGHVCAPPRPPRGPAPPGRRRRAPREVHRAAASASTTRRRTARARSGWAASRSCGPRWSAATSSSTCSPKSTSAPAGSSAARRWRAGGTRTTGCCCPARSCPSRPTRGLLRPVAEVILDRALEACATWWPRHRVAVERQPHRRRPARSRADGSHHQRTRPVRAAARGVVRRTGRGRAGLRPRHRGRAATPVAAPGPHRGAGRLRHGLLVPGLSARPALRRGEAGPPVRHGPASPPDGDDRRAHRRRWPTRWACASSRRASRMRPRPGASRTWAATWGRACCSVRRWRRTPSWPGSRGRPDRAADPQPGNVGGEPVLRSSTTPALRWAHAEPSPAVPTPRSGARRGRRRRARRCPPAERAARRRRRPARRAADGTTRGRRGRSRARRVTVRRRRPGADGVRGARARQPGQRRARTSRTAPPPARRSP